MLSSQISDGFAPQAGTLVGLFCELEAENTLLGQSYGSCETYVGSMAEAATVFEAVSVVYVWAAFGEHHYISC